MYAGIMHRRERCRDTQEQGDNSFRLVMTRAVHHIGNPQARAEACKLEGSECPCGLGQWIHLAASWNLQSLLCGRDISRHHCGAYAEHHNFRAVKKLVDRSGLSHHSEGG